MAEARSKRIAVSLTQREHDALAESAARQRIPLSRAVVRIIRAHLATGEDDASTSSNTAVADDQTPGPVEYKGPDWLPPMDQTRYRDWARDRAAAVQSLLDRYPGELSSLADDWAKDAVVREQLWALTVWRDLLDVGAFDDPRMELAFACALQDFAVFTEGRVRSKMLRRR